MFMQFISPILAAAAALVLTVAPAAAEDFRDADWSASFYQNCDAPKPSAIGWTTVGGDRKLQFTLAPGDVGGCKSDDGPRNGARNWERAELKQRGTLSRGKRHEIRFQATFVDGFHGKEENFFQIHGWTPQCSSAPLLMMQFNRGRMDVKVLQRASDPFKDNGVSRGEKGALSDAMGGFGLIRSPRMGSLKGKPHDFRVLLDMAGKSPRISIWMDGAALVEDKAMYMRDCSVPHVKFGLYRPGKKNRASSVLLIDDVRISSS
ncbi:MAG: heparin lyase I family protein [Roseivivax sp.]|nr:heparin lyase I family protein [Roseivivax sp.]